MVRSDLTLLSESYGASQSSDFSSPRTTIVVTIVLYCLVGMEIVRRRRAIKAITSDSVPLDDTVLVDTYNDRRASVATAVELEVRSPPRQVSTSYSVNESFATNSQCSASGTYTIRVPQRPALSFRQYILMPLFFFLALLSVWVAPTTNRVASFVDPSFSSYPLLLAVGATGSLRGFWNGLVFVTLGMKSWKRHKVLDDGGHHVRD